MCEIASINFRKGKQPKITYLIKGNNIEKFTAFVTKNLMQASDLKDSKGKTLYEGDVCLLKNNQKFIFENITLTSKIKKLGTFKIIGNIFDRK